ncbi:MAG: DRTGG domain-containing protein [Dehalococcoidia bacterium]|nr:DRTGG domain-containing protein [Dehalococcoidia bacterium]
MRVDEIATTVEGEIVLFSEKADKIAESLMLGAISPESAVNYFQRKSGKAVIIAGDRPDIQLAALETSTACLVITDGQKPRPIVRARAEDQGVPLIVTALGTMQAVEKLEAVFGVKK